MSTQPTVQPDGGAPFVERFAELAPFQRNRSPFSAALCDAIATRPHVANLLGLAPEHQQLPVLLLAALHDTVLAQPDCELAAWYPNLSPSPPTGDIGPTLDRHVAAHRDDLAHTVATRSVQTNEIGRCSLLLTGIASLERPDGPIGLVDVGTSAGLNLWMDRYRYEFRDADGSTRSVGSDHGVSLAVDIAGSLPVPTQVPAVHSRIGIDTAPISLDDERSVRWLTACIWPDQIDRIERFEAAVKIARQRPAELRQVDAVDGVAAAVDDIASEVHPVVMHSWVLNYLPPDRRRAFAAELDRIGAGRDLSWVFAEAPNETPELPHPAESTELAFTAVNTVVWRDGRRSVRHLGMAHPHGYWLRGPGAAPPTR